MSLIYSWEFILILILTSTVVTDSQQYIHSWPNMRQRPSPMSASPYLSRPYLGQTRNPFRTATGSALPANRNRQNSFTNRMVPTNSYPRRMYNSNIANRRLVPSRNRVTPFSRYQIPKPNIYGAVNNRNYNRFVPRNSNNFGAVRKQLNQRKSGTSVNQLSNVPKNIALSNQRQNRNQLHGPTSSKPSLRPPDGYKITYCKIYNSTHHLVTFSPISQQTKGPENAFEGRRIGVHSQSHLNYKFPRKLQTKYVFVRTEDYVVCSRPFFAPTIPNIHKLLTSTQKPIAKPLLPNAQRDHFSFNNKPKYTPKSVLGRNQGLRRPRIRRPNINHSLAGHQRSNVHRLLFPKNSVPQSVPKSIPDTRSRPSLTASRQTARPFHLDGIKSILSGNLFSTKNSLDGIDKTLPLEKLKSFALNKVTPVFSEILNHFLKKLEDSPLLNPLQIPIPQIQYPRKTPREQSNRSKQAKKSKTFQSNSKSGQASSTPRSRSTTSKSINSRPRSTTSKSVNFRLHYTTFKPKSSRSRSTTSKTPNSSQTPSTTTTSKPKTSRSKLHLTSSRPLTTRFTRLPKLTTPSTIIRRRRPPPIHHHRRRPRPQRPHHRRPHHRRPQKHVVKQKIRLYIPPNLRKEFHSNKEEQKDVIQKAIEQVKESSK